MRPTFSLALLAIVIVVGCAGRSQDVTTPVPKPAVSATSSVAPPSPTPSASVPAANDTKKDAVDARLEQELAEERKHPEAPPPPAPYAASCPNTARSPLLAACKAGKRAGSCAQCPTYTAFAGSDHGQVELALRGSFSGPYEEALVLVGGCGPHSENYGGLLLTRKVDGGWVTLAYLPGVVPQSCEAGPKVDGASRVVCVESHGLNSGTYETQATLIDFRARRVDHLLYAMCEDGIDVERARWSGTDKQELRVSVEYGVRRDNDGQGCVDVGGAQQRAELVYVEASGGYAPTPATEKRLRKLKPRDPEHALDPAVAAATGASERIPSELMPERAQQPFNELLCLEP